LKKLIKAFIGTGILLAALVALLLVSGTLSVSSFRMAANVLFGIKGPSLEESAAYRDYQLPQGFRWRSLPATCREHDSCALPPPAICW
jgi:hypothetical protein